MTTNQIALFAAAIEAAKTAETEVTLTLPSVAAPKKEVRRNGAKNGAIKSFDAIDSDARGMFAFTGGEFLSDDDVVPCGTLIAVKDWDQLMLIGIAVVDGEVIFERDEMGDLHWRKFSPARSAAKKALKNPAKFFGPNLAAAAAAKTRAGLPMHKVHNLWRDVQSFIAAQPAAAAKPKIVVTRHPALVEHLRATGVIDADTEVISHATPDAVRGREVIGILPLDLAVLAASVTIVPLALTAEMRGRELSEDEVRRIAGAPRTFTVSEVGV